MWDVFFGFFFLEIGFVQGLFSESKDNFFPCKQSFANEVRLHKSFHVI